MKIYKYTAIDASGQIITSRIPASSQEQAADALKQKGLKLIELKRSFFSKNTVKSEQISEFFSRLALLLKARMNLLKALKSSAKGTNGILKTAVDEIIKDIRGGSPFSAALKKFPFFTKMQSALIEIGEKTGQLDKVTAEIARIEKQKIKFISDIKLLLIYPSIVLGAAGLAVLFLFLFVLPKLRPVFLNFNISLPLSTRIIFFISEMLSSYFLWVGGGAILAFFLIKKLFLSKEFKNIFYKISANLSLYKYYLFGIYFSNLSLCINSGFNPVESIAVSNNALNNPYIHSKMSLIYLKIKQGRSMSECFQGDPFFEDLNIDIALSGEETSGLSESFALAAENLKERAETLIKKRVAIFEPAVIAVTGIIVGGVAASVLIPLFEITQSV